MCMKAAHVSHAKCLLYTQSLFLRRLQSSAVMMLSRLRHPCGVTAGCWCAEFDLDASLDEQCEANIHLEHLVEQPSRTDKVEYHDPHYGIEPTCRAPISPGRWQ